MGGHWRAAQYGCDSDPCNPQGIEEQPDLGTTWGRIKALYRN